MRAIGSPTTIKTEKKKQKAVIEAKPKVDEEVENSDSDINSEDLDDIENEEEEEFGGEVEEVLMYPNPHIKIED